MQDHEVDLKATGFLLAEDAPSDPATLLAGVTGLMGPELAHGGPLHAVVYTFRGTSGRRWDLPRQLPFSMDEAVRALSEQDGALAVALVMPRNEHGAVAIAVESLLGRAERLVDVGGPVPPPLETVPEPRRRWLGVASGLQARVEPESWSAVTGEA